MGDRSSLAVCLVMLMACAGRGRAADRVQIKLDTSEADRVLSILDESQAKKTITDADWNGLFATEPYQRLKKREAAMGRSFTDDDFKKFVLSPELAAQAEALKRTLADWKHADMKAAGERTLGYLPANAVVRCKVFPEIKPKHNSFVFDVDTDPAIFLYLDPTVSQDEFSDTISHEMHHIGLSSTDKLYDKKIASLPAGAHSAAEWMGAFGEGEAVLAAEGGPEVPATEHKSREVRENWVRGMQNFDQDLGTLNQFFLDAVNGKLTGDGVRDKAMTFFGEVQGPWYTVGYRMAVLVEKRFGRQSLIDCMLDRRLLLVRYNAAASAINRERKEKLPLWSAELLQAVQAPGQ